MFNEGRAPGDLGFDPLNLGGDDSSLRLDLTRRDSAFFPFIPSWLSACWLTGLH